MGFTFMSRPDGARVRELRRDREWTQAEFARRARLSRFTASKIETGQLVSKIVMTRVAVLLKVRLEDITVPKQAAELDGAKPDEAVA